MIAVDGMKRILGDFLLWSEEISSTQDAISSLHPESWLPGVVWGADVQTRGRGRYGRIWVSPKGGLYFSFLLPVSLIPLDICGFLLPVALQCAIDKLLPGLVVIRWPNDLIWQDKKIAGVLMEGKGEWIIAGVGVNVEVTPSVEDRLTASLRQIGWRGNKWEVLALFMDQFNAWASRPREEIIRRYQTQVKGIPGTWRVYTNGREEIFVIKGITDSGLVKTDKGTFSYLDLIEEVK